MQKVIILTTGSHSRLPHCYCPLTLPLRDGRDANDASAAVPGQNRGG